MIFFPSDSNQRHFMMDLEDMAPDMAGKAKERGAVVQFPGEQAEQEIIDLARSYGATIQEWSV